MRIIKDFMRLMFGLRDDEPIANYQVAIVFGVVVFVCFMLSIAL